MVDTIIAAQCRMCKNVHRLKVDGGDYDSWRLGFGRVQALFPYLDDDQRELLVSGICGTCFDAMYADDDDEAA